MNPVIIAPDLNFAALFSLHFYDTLNLIIFFLSSESLLLRKSLPRNETQYSRKETPNFILISEENF